MKKYADIEEIDEKELDDIQSDKRNREILAVLNKISATLSSKDDKKIINAIKDQQEKIIFLINSLKNIEKDEKYQNNVVSLTEEIRKDIVESNNRVIAAIESRLLPDSFDLVKNQFGVTQSVNVNYKQAKYIS